MEKSSVYTDKGGRVTWYIATAFGGADRCAENALAQIDESGKSCFDV